MSVQILDFTSCSVRSTDLNLYIRVIKIKYDPVCSLYRATSFTSHAVLIQFKQEVTAVMVLLTHLLTQKIS